VAFDGTTIVSTSFDKTVRIWRAPYNTADCVRVIEGNTNWKTPVWLCTAPNEHIVIIVDQRVHVRDVRTGDLVCAPFSFVQRKLLKQYGAHH
jgi:WD40 repeat protein